MKSIVVTVIKNINRIVLRGLRNRIAIYVSRKEMAREISKQSVAKIETGDKLTVLLLAYHKMRHENINLMIASALRCDFIDKIVVSNNNPKYDVFKFVKYRDEKIELVNQEVNRICAYRYEILQDLPGEFFLLIDDDTVLLPTQIKFLFQELIKNPKSAHGIWGERYGSEKRRLSSEKIEMVVNEEAWVHNLNRVYFLSSENAKRTFYYMKNHVSKEQSGQDDVILGFASLDVPYVHHIGKFFDCVTANLKGVALWRADGFSENRYNIVKKLFDTNKRNSEDKP